MFKSVPICILTAGKTVDGREVSQQVIDDIALTYDPSVYNARINEEHYSWSYKLGSVASVEKRDNQLFAVIKPNSRLLSTVEDGQLLHTSVEYLEDFAGTGKAYLTGLALTDRPASLGTTEIKLSSQSKDKVTLSSGATVDLASLTPASLDADNTTHAVNDVNDVKLLGRIKQLLGINVTAPTPSSTAIPPSTPSNLEENKRMSDPTNKELGVLLEKQATHITTLLSTVSTLSKQVDKLTADEANNADDKGEETPTADDKSADETQALSAKVEGLSTKFDALITTLSAQTDEDKRLPAGGETAEYY